MPNKLGDAVLGEGYRGPQPISMGTRLFLDLVVVLVFTVAAVLMTGGGAASGFVGAFVGMVAAGALTRSLRDRRASH